MYRTKIATEISQVIVMSFSDRLPQLSLTFDIKIRKSVNWKKLTRRGQQTCRLNFRRRDWMNHNYSDVIVSFFVNCPKISIVLVLLTIKIHYNNKPLLPSSTIAFIICLTVIHFSICLLNKPLGYTLFLFFLCFFLGTFNWTLKQE